MQTLDFAPSLPVDPGFEMEIRAYAAVLRETWGDNLAQVEAHLESAYPEAPDGLINSIMYEFEDAAIEQSMRIITAAAGSAS